MTMRFELLTIILLVLFLSFPVSIIQCMIVGPDTSVCKTNGYYLPATFLFCKLKEPRN